MKIIIDGYNVIGVSHRDIEGVRKEFINILTQYRQKKKHDITVVFDGWKGGRGETTSFVGSVRVIYSGIGERADEVIKRIISSAKMQWIVVSSDREIVSHAWTCGCVPVGSEDFEKKMYQLIRKRIGNLTQNDDEDLYNERTKSKKGNPRMLSKKEKMIKRALDKL